MNLLKRKKDNKAIFLEHERKKTWVDEKSNCKCFMLYARSLYVTSGSQWKWNWKSFKYTNDENIEVAKIKSVCWLDVRGKFKTSDLSPGTLYEVVYEVKLTNGAFGWELPINLRLCLPTGNVRVQERQVSILQRPRGKWIELNVGNFRTNDEAETGEVCFDLYEHGGHWKKGLIIRGAIFRPKI